jgi:murein L,D-transpeptidase YafK
MSWPLGTTQCKVNGFSVIFLETFLSHDSHWVSIEYPPFITEKERVKKIKWFFFGFRNTYKKKHFIF